MYASLLISLLAAFVAMLGKQWLNRYLRHAGGSMVERCGDRQRKCDGLEKWPFHLFIESLPIMLQMSLLLLACGLCRYTWSIDTSVAFILITLTVLGILFYFAIVIAGTSSYECPFQTPASSRLRSLWKEIQRHKTLLTCPTTAIGPLWKNVTHPITITTHRVKHTITGVTLGFNQWVHVTFGPRPPADYLLPVVSLEETQENPHASSQPSPPSPHDKLSSHQIDSPTPNAGPSHCNSSSSQETPTHTTGDLGPWLTQEDLTTIERTNVKDVRCVSWILRNITDPEALDAAIRLAGTVRWFEDGISIEPPYSVIVSVFHACLDSTGIVYPGLSERAYYSARAMLWIHIRASCVSEEFANNFALPAVKEGMPGHQDLSFLLTQFDKRNLAWLLVYAEQVTKSNTHVHMQWTLYAFLHKFWAEQERVGAFHIAPRHRVQSIPWDTIPLDTTLNLFLMWSIALGYPAGGEVLKIQDKTYGIPDFYFMPLTHTTIVVFAWQGSYPNYPMQSSQPSPPPPHSSGV